MNFLKKYKNVLIVLLVCVAFLYAAFLFILPNAINLNNYKSDIQKIVEENAKLHFDFQDLKIVTTPSLKAGIRIKGAEISYPESSKLASLDTAEVKISLLPLLFKTLQISDVSVNKANVSLVYLKNGQFDIVEYLAKNMPSSENQAEQAQEMPLKISLRLPVVNVNSYVLTLKDEKTSNKLTLNGKNFVLKDAVVNKNMNVFADGQILVNDKENVDFNIKINTYWPQITASSETSTQPAVVPQIDFINEIVKFDPKADINVDMKIKEHNGHTDLNGTAYIDKFSLKLDGKKLPDSFFRLTSKGHETDIESDLYLSASEKASLKALVKHSHSTKIDLNLNAEKITFASIKDFVQALLNSLNIENELSDIKTGGYINSNLSLKTDLKNFESSGYFRVIDGFISHRTMPVKINQVVADLDFSNNSLKIKNAGALVNGTTINANGSIDSSAMADLTVKSGDINLAQIFNAFAPTDLKKAYYLNNGILNFDVIIKGQLARIEPDINISLKKLFIKDRASVFSFSNALSYVKIKTKPVSNGISYSGDIDLESSVLNLYNPSVKISAPSVQLKITPDKLTIVPFTLTMNSSKADVSGSVNDYMKDMKIDILSKISLNSKDIKNMLPLEFRSFVDASGVIPAVAKISGDISKIKVDIQAYSSKNNNFAPVRIKKMLSKPGLLNIEMDYKNDNLHLADASLYLSNKSNISEDFSYNKKGTVQIAGLTGSVENVTSANPLLKLNFSVPQTLTVSNAAFPSAVLSLKGDVAISGNASMPVFRGFFSIKDVNVPEILTKIQAADIELNDETLSAKIQNLDINGTPLNIDADASTRFSNIFLIKRMILTSTNFDVDKLFAAMEKITKAFPASNTQAVSASSSSKLVVPVKISDGKIDIQKLKMKQIGGDLIITAITGDFTLLNDLFKLNNLKAAIYNGSVDGNVTYNLANTEIKAKVSGKSVNANSAVTVFAALKDQIIGNVDFNADVKLKGSTYEQQMKSLNGNVDFSLKDGQMGSLGRFETFLKADNLLSQSFISTKIGSLVNTISPYNTGKFSYLNGDLKLVNGTAILNPVKMSGPHMSLLISGNVNILSMISSLQIMGSISPEVSAALGPINQLSAGKIASYIPKFGSAISSVFNSYNAAVNKSELEKIPALTPSKTGTQSFKVVLNGNLNNPASAVKSLKWLNTPEVISKEQNELNDSVEGAVQETSSVKQPSLPANKEELKEAVKEDLKNVIDNNEKVQELKQNKAVQTLGTLYKFYKGKSSSESTSTGTEKTEQ